MSASAIGLIPLVALAPVVVAVWRMEKRVQARVILLAAWLGVSGLVGVAGWYYSNQRSEDVGLETRPQEHREDGYLSSRNCKACHPHHHDTWDSSYHPRMTDIVTPERVVGEFEGEVTVAGVKYLLERVGDEYWAEFPDPDASGEDASRIRRRLVMSTGSHHMQVYWYELGEGRTLGQLPVIYLNEIKGWIPREAAFIRPPHVDFGSETGRWKNTCIVCHTTGHRPGMLAGHPAAGDQTRVAEFGIGCEACHGPGEEHAGLFQDPMSRYARHFGRDLDPAIVEPSKLDHRRSSQVCGQCHSISQAHTEESYKEAFRTGHKFLPGDDLGEKLLTSRGAHRDDPTLRALRDKDFWKDHFWDDGMVRVSGREYNGLVETPCFQRGELSCLSCHTMHQSQDDQRPVKEWANDQLIHNKMGNVACTQCHEEYEDRKVLQAHTHHGVDSVGSQCYNCHMPHTTYGLLKAIRSHTVDSPDIRSDVESGRPNACNLCHLDKTLEWAGGKLGEWYGISMPAALDRDQKEIPYAIDRVIKGDAGQRALIAWSMGWEAAQEASGSNWMAPYLSLTLIDPYPAVRYIGQRSLKTIPGFEDFRYDFLVPAEERDEASRRVVMEWVKQKDKPGAVPARPELMIDSETKDRLYSQRDHTPMLLNE